MLRFDIRRPELAGFVACKEDDAPCFLRIAFKHKCPSLDLPGREELCPPDLPNPTPGVYLVLLRCYPYIMQSKGPKTQVLKRFCKSLITLLKELLLTVSSLRVT